MKGFVSIYRKELYSLFASPIFYVVALTFLIIAGYFFYSTVAIYSFYSVQASQDPFAAEQLNLADMVVRPFFMDLSIVLLLVSPLLTMRLYAEERKSGTLELLFTYPVADRATMLAKFAAVLTAYIIILAGTMPGFVMLSFLAKVSWAPVLCGYIGVFLLGASFMSLGLFTSSLTQNQIIAAVLAFGAVLMFWIIAWVKNFVGPAAGKFFQYIAITQHLDSFTKGVLDSSDFVYYLIFITFFLFLTLRQMESYRWRG